jgi:hypothetical protein
MNLNPDFALALGVVGVMALMVIGRIMGVLP